MDNKSVVKYRREHDVRVIKKRGGDGASSMNRMASVGALLMNDHNASFGKANRAQTPVKGIICGDYGQAAESYYQA